MSLVTSSTANNNVVSFVANLLVGSVFGKKMQLFMCLAVLSSTLLFNKWYKVIYLAPVVQRLDNAIHRINHYPVDSVVCFVNTYPLDSDLSSGWRYPAFEQPGPRE